MKLELKSNHHQRQALQGARHGDQSVFFPGRLLRGSKAISIAFFIFKLKTIYRFYIGEYFLPPLFIEKYIQAASGAYAHMVIALRADIIVAFEVGPI
jgi:hypothetical protein